MTFILWIIFSILEGAIANDKGRSGFGYFMLAVLLSPIVGIIVVAVIGEKKDANNK